MLTLLWNVFYGIIAFSTITVPTWLFYILSYTLTFTFTFKTLALFVFILIVAGYLFLRYRYLNVYSRRSKDATAKKNNGQAFDLRPDTTVDEDQDDQSAHYPGEFLSAFLSSIRVFGYLEKPVFHELARHLQTRRLLAGDTMSDVSERERSFYFVVDGCVQVFAKRMDHTTNREYEFEFDEGDAEASLPGHALLNEVRPGGTLSSLFTILSLFTEDVPIRHEEVNPLEEVYHTYGQPMEDATMVNLGHAPTRSMSSTLSTTSANNENLFPYMSPSTKEMTATNLTSENVSPPASHRSYRSHRPTLSLTGKETIAPSEYDHPGGASDRGKYNGQHGTTAMERTDIVFRATADTTLAVIPAEAFKRVTEKFPNASAHMVQVILTRFQRVTFRTMENYLGLTKELLKIERKLGEMAMYDLPSDFHREGGLDRLRQQFLGGNRLKPIGNDNESVWDSHRTADTNDNGQDSGRSSRSSKPPRTPFRLDKDVERLWEQSSKEPCPALERGSNGRTPTTSTPKFEPYSAVDEQHLREQAFEMIKKSLGMLSTGIDLVQLRVESRTSSNSADDIMGSSNNINNNNNNSEILPSAMSPLQSHIRGLEGLAMSRDTSTEGATITPTLSPPTSRVVPELRNDVRIMFFPKGATLVKQNERNVGIYLVIDGVLDIYADKPRLWGSDDRTSSSSSSSSSSSPSAQSHKSTTAKNAVPLLSSKVKPTRKQKSLFLIRPGGVVGYLSALTGHPSFVNVRASTDTFVAYLPKESLDRMVERYPNVLLTLAKRLITILSPLVLHIDFALEWVQVNAGQILYHQRDDSDSIYVVLNGRLRSIKEGDTTFNLFREHGLDESIGELEVLTDSPRSSTLYAIRDSELARLPKTLFMALSLRHPEISIQMSRIIALRTHHHHQQYSEPCVSPARAVLPQGGQGDFGRNNINLKTIALLPISADVPISQFAKRLNEALENVGATALRLDHTTVTSVLGRHAFSKLGKLKLMHWLAEQEESYRIVLYVADSGVTSPWTQRCIRQADCILLVGHGDGDPDIGEYERVLLGMKSTARKELVLLHNERSCQPGSTRAWLKSRIWIQAHHHVQMPLAKRPIMIGNVRRKKTFLNLHQHIQEYWRNTANKKPPTPYTGNRSDFSRLARRILGKSVGLVLGGGGARGVAHIGVIRALEEAGIPIDLIGGTSMGAFIGGLYARDSDHMAIIGFAKMFCSRMISVWRQLLDLTYPITAYFTGHEFNRGLWKCFAETQIEDFWINFYCNTTNITFSRMECHHVGYAWRLIRASMSLSGLVPPVCDGGDLLLDGGYMDNLTVSYMKSLGAETIIAVDVGSVDDTSPVYYGDNLSGFWVLLQRWNPFRSGPAVPSLAEIQQRLAYVSSVQQLEEAKVAPGCMYVRPPVEGFGTLEFGKFDTIMEVGYRHGKECLRQWRKKKVLDKWKLVKDRETPSHREGIVSDYLNNDENDGDISMERMPVLSRRNSL